MALPEDEKIALRVSKLEQQLEKKPNPFIAALALALIPIVVGLYQFNLSNSYQSEENQINALISALEGETPSEICGNLSLLVEARLLRDERKVAAVSLIDQITGKGEIDGGIEIDCFPRIQASQAEPALTEKTSKPSPTAEPKSDEISFPNIELKYTSEHSSEDVVLIRKYLETNGIRFTELEVNASSSEISNYSGLVWYYYASDQTAAQVISANLEDIGIRLKARYYTRPGLPSGLPMRIWVPKRN